jgi:hypothetical protein
MRYVCRNATNKGTSVQIAGNARGPWLSACRALVRKGLMRTWRTGHYALTDEGQPIAEALVAEWREAREAAEKPA